MWRRAAGWCGVTFLMPFAAVFVMEQVLISRYQRLHPWVKVKRW